MNNIYNNSSEIKKDTLYQFDESDVFLFAGLTFILKFVLIVMSICDRDFKTLLTKKNKSFESDGEFSFL